MTVPAPSLPPVEALKDAIDHRAALEALAGAGGSLFGLRDLIADRFGTYYTDSAVYSWRHRGTIPPAVLIFAHLLGAEGRLRAPFALDRLAGA